MYPIVILATSLPNPYWHEWLAGCLMDDSELMNDFVDKARGHLGDIENQLLRIGAIGEAIDGNLVNPVILAIHSLKDAAGPLGLVQIHAVARRLENALGRIRDKKLIPDPDNVELMLRAADRIKTMIESVGSSNEIDNQRLCDLLDALLAPTVKTATAKVAAKPTRSRSEKTTTSHTKSSPAQRRPPAPHGDAEPAALACDLGSAADGSLTGTAVAARLESALDESQSQLAAVSELPGEDAARQTTANAGSAAGGEATIQVSPCELDPVTAELQKTILMQQESLMKMHIRRRLTTFFLLCGLVPMLILAATNLWSARRGSGAIRQQAADSQKETTIDQVMSRQKRPDLNYRGLPPDVLGNGDDQPGRVASERQEWVNQPGVEPPSVAL